MPDKYPPMTWPEYAEPSVSQLKEWIYAHDPAVHDTRIAADMILGMLEQEQRALAVARGNGRRYAARALRYRLAWLSARGRAMEHRLYAEQLGGY